MTFDEAVVYMRKLWHAHEAMATMLAGLAAGRAAQVAETKVPADPHPCSIRCWRVGDAAVVAPGDACPECGDHGS